MTQYKDDYMCIFKGTGLKLKLPAYVATKKFDEIKATCEAKYGKLGQYVRKNDWIDPNGEYGCYKVKLDMFDNPKRDSYGNFERERYPPAGPGVPPPHDSYILFHTKSECSKNKDISIYQTKDPKTPILKLDNFPPRGKEKKSRANLVIYTYIVFIILYIIWNLKYAIKRPYYLHDYMEWSVIFRIFILIILFGVIFVVFCPFESCWLPRFASKYRKEPLNQLFRDFCKFYKTKYGEDHTGCLVNKTVCDKFSKYPGCIPDPDYKYMNWVEEYNRLDYQLKDEHEKNSKDMGKTDVKNMIKDSK